MKPRLSHAASFGLILSACCSTTAFAQCDPHWLPGEGIRGLNGQVSALATWDPDGPGPLAPRMLAGGTFTIAGDIFASNIAAWDPESQSWSAIGGGVGGGVENSGGVRAIVTLSDGSFIVGGSFTTAGSISASKIARWNPVASTWSTFGSGFNDDVRTLALTLSGDVIAGGMFTSSGATPVSRIAQWSFATSSWSALGPGLNNFVAALAILPDGDVIAGGRFSAAGATPAANIARWNPETATWSPLGAGTGNALVSAIVVLPDGDLIVGGSFSTAGGNPANRVARWNAATSTWSPLGSGITGSAGTSGSVFSLAFSSDGGVFVAGLFEKAGGVAAFNIARWDLAASAWSPLDKGVNDTVRVLLSTSDGIVAGGDFDIATGNFSVSSIALWQSPAGPWAPFGSDGYGAPTTLLTLPSGDLIAARPPLDKQVDTPMHVLRWNAAHSTWATLGSGINGYVVSMTAGSDGDIIIGGDFSNAGGVTARKVARWSAAESAWKPMGQGFDAAVLALASSSDGRIIAGGQFSRSGDQAVKTIARWDAATDQWLPLGSGMTFVGGSSGWVTGMAFLPDGDIVAGGSFAFADGVPAKNIARWDSVTATWSPMGSGINSTIARVLVLDNGGLIAATADSVFRWNEPAGQWDQVARFTSVSSQSIYSLMGFGGGDFIAAGLFSAVENVPAVNIARWNNADSSWHAIDNGLSAGQVLALAPLPDGFAAGGRFFQAGNNVSAYFARFTQTNVPWVAQQPIAATLLAGETLDLSAIPVFGSSDVAAQWQRQVDELFINLNDGPGGASPNGGTVSNASGQLPSPTDGTPATLTIANIKHSDAGNYRVTFYNSCGEATSIPVAIKVKAHAADLNADGMVNDSDFVLFTTQYDLMLCDDPSMPDFCPADFNHDGLVDDADFSIFIPAYDIMLFQ